MGKETHGSRKPVRAFVFGMALGLGVMASQRGMAAEINLTLADSLMGGQTMTEIRDAAMRLQLAAPVRRWDEALPLGNGLMGGLLHGEKNELRISLDRGDLWDERPSPLVLREDFTWAHWLDLKEAEQWDAIDALFDEPYNQPTPTKIPGGRLEITLDASLKAELFSLDLAQAMGHVKFADSADVVECFYSATDNVALMRFPGTLPMTWRLVPPEVLQKELEYAPPEVQEEGDERWFVQAIPEGMDYAIVAAERTTDDSTYLAWTITATRTDGPDPLETGRKRVRRALDTGYTSLAEDHVAWWEAFWARSEVHVPDELHQLHYNLTRYLLGASSRLGAPPMGLQGVWTVDGELPPWKGDYHHDLNTQMIYLSYLAAGNFDEGRCFLEFMWERLPVFRQFARDFYGTPGAMFPAVMSSAGTPLGGWPMYSLMPQGNGSWVGWMFYRHWLYTQDEAFLRERAYPFCSELGICIETLLEADENGILRMPISSSPEIGDNTPDAYLPPNSNYDRDCMAAFFAGLAHMAQELGKSDDAERWANIAANLGERWFDPDTKVLGFARGHRFDQSHRHFSHLMAIHPFSHLTVEGDESDREVVHASLDAIVRYGTNSWCGYSHSWAACMHGRAQQGNEALRHLQIYSEAFTSRNGFHVNGNQKNGPGWTGARPFTLEGNFLAMEAIHDMLLQSWIPKGETVGVIRLFPAMPEGWTEASFENLRAKGGFRVSATWSHSAPAGFTITAETDGLLRLRDGFGETPPHWIGPSMTLSGTYYEREMRAGDTIEATFPRHGEDG